MEKAIAVIKSIEKGIELVGKAVGAVVVIVHLVKDAQDLVSSFQEV